MAKGLSIREFAKREGCSDTLVRRKLKSGHLIALDDGSIDAKLVGTAWRKSANTGANSAAVFAPRVRTSEDDAESIGEIAERILEDALGEGRPLLSKAQAEALKENYLALLQQLKYDREVGAVAPVAEITAAVAGEYQLVKNRLANIGSRVAPRCAVMKDAEEIKALIDREVSLALEELTLDRGGRGQRAAD